MVKEKSTKKKKSVLQKIGIGSGGILVIAVIAGALYWFSLPIEARNLISFMVIPTKSYDNYKEYQVVERNNEPLKPSDFDMIGAVDDNNVNIGTVTNMVKNKESSMLKIGRVQTTGVENYSGWQFLADEGAAKGEYPFGPSPLSYYTAGVASNLHTQILMAAKVERAILDDVTVEVINNFHWENMMDDDGTGHLGLCTVNIIIGSDEPDEVIERIKKTAINGWAAGQALMNETKIIPKLVINGDYWNRYYAGPGTSHSDVSYDGGFLMSSVTEKVVYPEYSELLGKKEKENLPVNMDTMNNLSFQIYAIAENMNNTDRPYYQSISISTPSGESWKLYADEFMGDNDIPLAPTPLEYFSVGTSLCLTSQTTLVNAMMGLNATDYRVEHFFEYSQKNMETANVTGSLDTVQTYVYVESDKSQETLEKFFNKSLALCFAGAGLVNKTDMNINMYVNGDLFE